MLIPGFFLRSSPHLSTLGFRNWPCCLGFHRVQSRGSTVGGLEEDRAGEKPGFSFPRCPPLQLPPLAPAPAAKAFCGSSFSQVTQAPRHPFTGRMLLIFPLLQTCGLLLSLFYHLCNQLPALEPLCFTQNSFCVPCRGLIDLFGKTPWLE